VRAVGLGLAQGQHLVRAAGRCARDARRRPVGVRRQGRTDLSHQLRPVRPRPGRTRLAAGPRPPPPYNRQRLDPHPRRGAMDAWATNSVQAADRVSAFLWKVYGWMAVGLGLTALVAFAVAGSPDLLRVLIGNRLVFFALVIAELGLVFFMSARADRLAPGTAAGLFALYSAL